MKHTHTHTQQQQHTHILTHTHTNTHTHTQTPLKSIQEKRQTEKCRSRRNHRSKQTDCSQKQTGGLRLKTSKRLTYRKIGTTLAPSLAHPLGASTHMLAAPLRRTSQRGTAHAATRTGPAPAILGKGGEMAGADQSADDPDPEPSREKNYQV